MESQLFREMVQKSLDNDLADMLYNNRVSVQAAMDLHMLTDERASLPGE